MRDADKGRVVAERAFEAESLLERLVGLIGARPLEPAEALWLRANGVHTFGMRFVIDVVILDSGGRVLRIAPRVRQNRIVWPVREGRITLEMAAGAAEAVGIEVGVRLVRSDKNT